MTNVTLICRILILLSTVGYLLLGVYVSTTQARDPDPCGPEGCSPCKPPHCEPPRIPTNRPPSALKGKASIKINTELSGQLKAVDSDGDKIKFFSAYSPANGTLNILTTGAYTYVPRLNFTGSDKFGFFVRDSHGNKSNEATVDIQVVSSAAGFTGKVVSSGSKVLSSGVESLPVKDATVHLIPTKLINRLPKITSESLRNDSDFDEPLEDTISRFPDEIPWAKTDPNGQFKFENIPDAKFFVHVTPGPKDLIHLSGGSESRIALSTDELLEKEEFTIVLSSGQFKKDNTFKGSHTCVDCHKRLPDWEKTGKHWNRTGHKLGWSVPGKKGADQDFSNFPTWFRALEYWKLSKRDTIEKIEIGCPDRAPPTKGGSDLPRNPVGKPTHLEIGDYTNKDRYKKPTAGFKVRFACDSRIEIKNVFADVFLWKDGDGKHFITIVNRVNPTHENATVHLRLEFVYGGGVHRQRYVVSVPKELQKKYGTRRGHYTILQFNTDGSDARWNVDRRVWRDYKFSYWWNIGKDGEPGTNDDFINPPEVNENTIEAECAGCHVTGAKRIAGNPNWKGQVQIIGITDADGAFDIDQDGAPDEVNVGCESCHGPGSAHNKAMRADRSDIGIRRIINPKLLSAERADLICGRCHDRRQAKIGNAKTQAVNVKGEFFPAGERRQKIVTEYSKAGEAGPLLTKKHLWADNIHSRSPRQQYSEHVKSAHYKNDRILVSCSDCHAAHGETTYSSWLKGDPKDPYSSLCQSCHQMNSPQHMFDKGHPRMEASLTSCISCHMVGTSRPGGDSGQYGLFAKRPPFRTLKEEKESAYWEGNLNSHVFDVPSRKNRGVWGKLPANAMPIPYTNSCGVCHNVSPLQSGRSE